jgi:hypothetical protein
MMSLMFDTKSKLRSARYSKAAQPIVMQNQLSVPTLLKKSRFITQTRSNQMSIGSIIHAKYGGCGRCG